MQHLPTEQISTRIVTNVKTTTTATNPHKHIEKKKSIYYPLTVRLMLFLLLSPPQPKIILRALTHCTWMNRCYYNKRLQNVSTIKGWIHLNLRYDLGASQCVSCRVIIHFAWLCSPMKGLHAAVGQLTQPHSVFLTLPFSFFFFASVSLLWFHQVY